MIVLGVVLGLAFFVLIGWVISTEMFQQRSWRRRVAAGDREIVEALILETLAAWRCARPPRDVPAFLWAGVQRAELAVAFADFAVVQSSAEGEFHTIEGRREQVTSTLDEARALAAKLVEMMLYDVPNISLSSIRVDVYSTFTVDGGAVLQQPILTTTAHRADVAGLDWEALAPAGILARFETVCEPTEDGRAIPIALPPIPRADEDDDRQAS